jgi:hypothetical protein
MMGGERGQPVDLGERIREQRPKERKDTVGGRKGREK